MLSGCMLAVYSLLTESSSQTKRVYIFRFSIKFPSKQYFLNMTEPYKKFSTEHSLNIILIQLINYCLFKRQDFVIKESTLALNVVCM